MINVVRNVVIHKLKKAECENEIEGSHFADGIGDFRINHTYCVFCVFIVGNQFPPLFILSLQKATTGKPEFSHCLILQR